MAIAGERIGYLAIPPHLAEAAALVNACTFANRILGYINAPRPQGSFYVFPKTPIPDDLEFIRLLQTEGILAVPGSGFGRGGYMRLSLTIPRGDIERALPGFERAIRRARAGG